MTVFDLDTPHLNSASRSEFSGATKAEFILVSNATHPADSCTRRGRVPNKMGRPPLSRRSYDAIPPHREKRGETASGHRGGFGGGDIGLCVRLDQQALALKAPRRL